MPVLNLSIEIPSDSSVDAKEAFLAMWPNIGGVTDEEWIVLKVQKWLQVSYEKGKKKISDNNTEVISNIFTASPTK
jgi:hypothetical protein